MALPTNTFTTYSAAGNREDLSDVIYRIDPTDTPFLTGIEKAKATAVLHEWQTQALAAVNTGNAALEGDDAAADATTPTVRLGNVAQISRKVPQVSGTNDYIWAYWGNPAQTNLPDYSVNGAVWLPLASPFDAVYHLEQTGFPYADSTTQHPATTGTAPTLSTGIIGSGDSFSRSPYLDVGPITLGDTFTLSAWINVSSTATDIQSIWANGPGGYSSAGLRFYVNDYQTADGALLIATGNGSAGAQLATPAGAVSFNQWHLVTAAVSRDSGTAQLYVDGVRKASGGIRTDFPTNNDVNFARFTDGFFAFKGLMDEARIQQGLASSNWVWASWMNVASNSTWQNYSTVVQQQPMLTIGADPGGNVCLNWPGYNTGFGIFTATNLAPPVVWTLQTNQPVFVSNRWQIVLPPDDGKIRFYQLKSL